MNQIPEYRTFESTLTETLEEDALTEHAEVLDTTQAHTSIARVDMKFEVVVIPVSDVDRAKEFLREARVAARRRGCT